MVPTRLGRLHVRFAGPESGRPTILWPSMFVDSRSWDLLLPLLVAESTEPRRYVLIDPPGLGRSDALRRRSCIAEAADAATDALDELGLSVPVDWLGNAFGGHVGFDLATRPGLLRSLVAISSPVEAISPSLRRQIRLLAPLLRTLGPVGPVREAILGAMLTDASAATPALRDVVLESIATPSRASLSIALRSFILERTDVSATLPDIAVPSLFVASDDRGDWSPEDALRSAAATPDARVVTIPGARTLIALERPRLLADVILPFWARAAEADLSR